VVGAGFMGSGIAQVSAQAGYQVHLMDIQTAVTDKALENIRLSLKKLDTKGLLKESSEKVLDRIYPEKDLSKASEVDWVIEAALEEEALKQAIFKELDRISKPETPLATILLPSPSPVLPSIRTDRRGCWDCISSDLCR